MNWHVLTEKLPPEWFRIMIILAHSLTAFPHHRVKMWWRLSGKQLRWTEFLGFLTQLEPLSKEGELVFQPLFYHLPDYLQKHTLQFIYQHCDDINLTVFNQFLQSLFEICRSKANWIDLYLNLLQNRMICRQKEDKRLTTGMQRTEKKCDTFQTSLTTEFKFSERSTAQLLNLCEKMRMASNCGTAWNVAGLFSRSIEIGEEELRKPSPSASGTSQANDFGEVVIHECMDVQQEVTEISLEKSVAVNDMAQIESVISIDREMPGCVVDYEIQTAVLRLRESWLREQAVDPEIVILLKTLSPKQLQNVLEQMEVLNLPDTSVLLACQTFVECASQQISYENVFLFASTFLLPQILKLEQAASRLFAAAVVSFVKTFPLHSIEGLLQPLLASTCSCGQPQSELVIKVVREAFSNQHQQELLHVLLDRGVKTWSDQMMLVVQSIIDAKVELPSDHLKHLLLTSLEYNSLANSSNRKFGKLLLSFVQIYGHMLTPAELRQCSQVADLHKTFLTKLMKSTLAKLSTDTLTFQ